MFQISNVLVLMVVKWILEIMKSNKLYAKTTK